MYYLSGLFVSAIVLVLAVGRLRTFLARRRFIREHGLTTAPKVDGQFADFKRDYEAARRSSKAVPFLSRLLFNFPGRTTTVQVAGETWLFSSDTENVKAILATRADDMSVESLRKDMLKGWVGDGMFASDGQVWKLSRNLFKPMFSRAPISELRQWEKHTNAFFNLLPENGTTVDLQPMFKKLYFDASMETLLGESANCQVPDQATFDVEKFEKCFEEVMIGAYQKWILRYGADKVAKDWQEKCDYIHSIFDKYIDRALDERRESQTPSDASMVHSLIDSSGDKQFLRDQLLNVFLGAKDTAGIGISIVVFFLARHPQVYEKIRAEVAMIDNRPLTFELLKSMKYLQNVIAECLRIHSPVSIIMRVAARDCMLPHGGGSDGQEPVFVAKGTRIESNLAVLHRDTRLWGEDSEEFRPERFNGLAPKWEYAPFGGGARMCPAQQMMLTQYAYLLVKIARKYSRIENRDPVEEFVPQVVFSQQSKNGVLVAFYQ